MAGPFFRTFQSLAGAGAANAVVNRPNAVYDDDYLVCALLVEGASRTITAPGGWALLDERSSSDGTQYVYTKRASDEPTSWTWSWTGSVYREAVLHVAAGARQASDPVDDWSEADGSGTSVVAAAVDTTGADRLLIMGCFNWFGGGWTPPGSMAERYDGGGSQNMALFDVAQAAAGSSGTKTATSGGGGTWVAHLVALAPADEANSAERPFLVGAGTPVYTATNGASLSPGWPADIATNDIAILLYHISSNDDLSNPSGWTELLDSSQNNTTAQRVEVFAKRYTAGDTAPTLTGPSNTNVRGAQIFAVRGCPASMSIAQAIPVSSRSSNAASATITWATITPPNANSLLLKLYAYEDDPTAASEQTGWSFIVVGTSSLGNDMALGYATRAWTAANSAVGAVTSTASGGTFANSVNVGIMLAFTSTGLSVELSGRPDGLHGAQQMTQLLAQ